MKVVSVTAPESNIIIDAIDELADILNLTELVMLSIGQECINDDHLQTGLVSATSRIESLHDRLEGHIHTEKERKVANA